MFNISLIKITRMLWYVVIHEKVISSQKSSLIQLIQTSDLGFLLISLLDTKQLQLRFIILYVKVYDPILQN